MAAPAFGAAGTQLTAATAASAAVAVPAGVAANDVILVHLYKETTAAVTPPAGFTEVGTPVTGTAVTQHAFWKRATAADSGTYTFSWTGSVWREAIAVRYTGAALSGNPVDVFATAARSTAGTVTPAVSVTTTGIERLLVWAGTNVNGGTWTAPAGYTLRSSGTTWQSVATVAQNAQGSSGSVTGTCSTSAEETAWLIALLPPSTGGPIQTIEPAGYRPRWAPKTRRGRYLQVPPAADPNLPIVTDGGTGVDTVTVVEQLTVADTATATDTVVVFDAVPISTADTGAGVDTVNVLDVLASTLLPQRQAPNYEVIVVARVPAAAGPPTLIEIDPILWTTLDWTTELSKPQTLNLTCRMSTLTESVLQRLRSRQPLPTELRLLRNGQIVFAGPLTGGQRQGENLTLHADGLLAFLGRMVVFTDLAFTGVDQFAVVKAMVDQWQGRPYGSFGIDTSTVGLSGTVRDATYLAKELDVVLAKVQEMGLRDNGFDVDVDPVTRQLMLWNPIRGVDRSAGEDAVVFDSRNITNASVMFSLAPQDVATVAFGTGTGGTTGGTLYGAPATNTDLLAQYGASAVTGTWSSISEQPSLDAHVASLLAARGSTLFVPGQDVRVTPDADRSSYDAGDTVRFAVDDQIGVDGPFRLRSVKTAVSAAGLELITPTFV